MNEHQAPSPRSLRVAVTQWHATRDMQANLGLALELVAEAGAQDAQLILLPENGLMLGSNAEMRGAALTTGSAEIDAIREAAKRAHATVVIGGFKRKSPGGQVHNTALVIGTHGELLGGYDKIHMFDATIDGQKFAASNGETPGKSPAMTIVNGVKVGLTICYDLRFPELYRQLALAGAEIFLVPSAFTQTTGKAHWEVLLRARAIENAAFVVASATIRGSEADDAFATYGHALVVNPWGEVLTDLGESRRACQVIDLMLDKVGAVRQSLPVLRSVSPSAYSAPLQVIESHHK